tara:strand:+ start:21138 stop:21293 length:156 start_codon:yes stop_codon:yes gene_type:complete
MPPRKRQKKVPLAAKFRGTRSEQLKSVERALERVKKKVVVDLNLPIYNKIF